MSQDWARNWWGTAWVEKMERLAESRRFGEGAQYAKSGRVPEIKFDGRTITAKVQGSGEPAYTVRISFDPFSREDWDRLLVELRSRTTFAASLSSGDLPLETQTAFSKVKLRFMPERYVDLHLECACPDWLKPCKHLVAVWLKFARDFDRDPFLVFELRGMKRDEFLDLLEDRAPEAVPEPEPEELPEIVCPVALESLPSDPEAFWSAPALPETPEDSPERMLLDGDIFETLSYWSGLEPQFRQIYDSVYDLASLLRSSPGARK